MEHRMTATERELIEMHETNRSSYEGTTKQELISFAEEFGIDFARAVVNAKHQQIADDIAGLDEVKKTLGHVVSVEAAQWVIRWRNTIEARREDLYQAARRLETWQRDRDEESAA